MSERAWVGVDLDGTIAHYNPADHNRIGPPIQTMVARVREWIAKDIPVKIVTARVASTYAGAHHERVAIEDWCFQHIGVRLPVTAEKDFALRELYDDRCVQVETNTGLLVAENLRDDLGELHGRAMLYLVERDEALAKVAALEARWADHEKNIGDQRALQGLTIEEATALLQEDDFIVTMVKGPIPGMLLGGMYSRVSQDGRYVVLKQPICTVAPANIGLVKRGDEIIYQHPRHEEQ